MGLRIKSSGLSGNKGWRNEPIRHGLARKGVKTGEFSKSDVKEYLIYSHWAGDPDRVSKYGYRYLEDEPKKAERFVKFMKDKGYAVKNKKSGELNLSKKGSKVYDNISDNELKEYIES